MPKGFLWLIFLSIFFACNSNEKVTEGNGTIVEEERKFEDFSSIVVEGGYNIELEQGEPSILIKTDENLIPLIQAEVKRNTLRLSNSESLKGSEGITIRIRYPELEKLEIGGAAKVSNAGTIGAKDLEIAVKGAALVDLEVEARKLELDLDGASSVSFKGTAQQLEADLSGAGNLEAYELRVRDAVVKLSGIGNAEVYVTDNLQAKVSGVGSIRYKGDPQNIQRDVSGVGSIKPAGADNN